MVCVAAAPASKILAQPGTITGSIGVIFARFKAKEALEEYGITSDTIKLGDNANWASPFHSLTPKQQQQVRTLNPEPRDIISAIALSIGQLTDCALTGTSAKHRWCRYTCNLATGPCMMEVSMSVHS